MALYRPDQWGYASWSTQAVGTISGATASHSLATNAHVSQVTGIQCSGDAAALVTIESPANTVLWRKRFAAAFTHSEGFVTPIAGTSGAAVLVKISASTANCEANIQGYDV